jgi:hypothetical protein
MSKAPCGRLATLSLLVAAAPLRAQDATPNFQTTTELVLVDVQALQLQAKDLRVFEDGVPHRRSASPRGTNRHCR